MIHMNRLFIVLNDVVLGGYAGAGVSTYADTGDTSIIGTFAEMFTSGWNLITENPALFGIICVAVGAPILATIIAIFKK